MQNFSYLEPYKKRPKQRFYLSGVGSKEWMEPQVINRPQGTWDWLLMLFHSPVSVEIEGELQTYQGNTFVIWPENASHHYGNAKEKWCHSWVHCEGNVISSYLKDSGLRLGVFNDMKYVEVFSRYLPLIYRERILGQQADFLIIENLFHCLLRELGRIYKPSKVYLPDRIQKVKYYVDSHFAEPIQLSELCELVSLSKPHLTLLFKKYLKVSPIEYMIKLRCERAKNILFDQNRSVADVARQVGYDNIYHFSSIFKKHMGTSPSSFRKKNIT